MSDDELVPRWLRILFAILRAAPWTEIKSAIACAGVMLTGLWLVVAAFFHVTVDVAALDSWLLFMTGAWGIASVAQGWKQSVAARIAPSPSLQKDGAV